MPTKREIIVTGAALLLGAAIFAGPQTHTAFAASEKEEAHAAKAGATLLLTMSKCSLDTVDVEKVIKQTNNAYDLSGVHPTDYKPGEWTRKIFFTINQTDWLRAIDSGNPEMVKTFCKSMSESFPITK